MARAVLHPCLVLVGEEAGRWAGRHLFPDAQAAKTPVLGQHAGEGGRAGAGEPHAEELDLDLLLVYLGVQGVPVLDLQAVDQRSDQGRVEGVLAEFVEGRLAEGGADEDFESLPPAVAAEVVEPGLRRCQGDEVVDPACDLIAPH